MDLAKRGRDDQRQNPAPSGTHHEIEARHPLGAVVVTGDEIHARTIARGRVTDASEYPVRVVTGESANVHLRGELQVPGTGDAEVDVWRSSRIGHGLDRAEAIATVGVAER